jgi:arabinogalactan oligomer/maltooligosaccharide transport system permease protein
MNKENEENIDINLSEKDSVLTDVVEPIDPVKYFFMNLGKSLLKILLWILDLLYSIVLSLGHFFAIIGKGIYKGVFYIERFFQRKYHQFRFNDWSGRLSFVLFGSSSFKHHQIGNGILYILFEIGYIIFMALGGISNLAGLGTLGVNVPGEDPSCEDQFCEWIAGDNSVMFLVYGLLTIFSLFLFFYIMNRSINNGYNNYRIDNFTKFQSYYEDNKEISLKLDSKIEGYLQTVKPSKNTFKKTYKEEIDTYILKIDISTKEGVFAKDFAKYIISETIRLGFINHKKINKLKSKVNHLIQKREELEKSCNIKYEQLANKLTEKENNLQTTLSNEDFIALVKKDKISLEMLENKNSTNIHNAQNKIDKQNNLLREIVKTTAPFAVSDAAKHNGKYEKFNFYYVHRKANQDNLVFYKNYQEICSVYDSNLDKFEEANRENASKKIEIGTVNSANVVSINKKYDDMLARKRELLTEINKYKNLQEEEIKQVKKDPSIEDKAEKILAIKDKYFTPISTLSGDFSEYAEDKNIKAMRVEEIKECKHSFKRDQKYLKTNYTSVSYAKEETINYMMLNYDFEFGMANEFFEKVIVKDKKTKTIGHLSDETINNEILKIEKEDAEFVKNNPSKFVGKCKTFKQQIQSLLNENFHLTVLTLPVIGIIFFTVMPLFFSILVAFTNYSYGHVPPQQLFTWYGLQNFINLFAPSADSQYATLPSALGQTISWTIIWTICATFSNYFLGILLALAINKKGIKFKKLWRTIFILTIAVPQFISLMSIGVLLKDSGAIGTWFNETFGYRLGFGTSNTDSAVFWSKFIIILVNIWIGIPYTMLSTSGILMNIPTDLYESAKVDGASPWQQFKSITMPYILFVTGPYLITQFIGNVNNFNVIYFLTGGGPNIAGTTLQVGRTDLAITFIYKLVTSTNNPQYGIASSVGLVVFAICALFSIVMYNKSSAVQSEDQFQ